MSSRVENWLGLRPGDGPRTASLGALMALTTFGEVVTEGAVTSAFLARIGADALPLALAWRALMEVGAALLYGRVAGRWPALRSASGTAAIGTGVLGLCAVVAGEPAGAYVAFVVATALIRLRVIHFGVLALAELRGGSATRALPVVYACSRVGAIVAGPTLGLLGPRLGLGPMLLIGALASLCCLLLLLRPHRWSTEAREPHEAPPESVVDEPHLPGPTSGRASTDVSRAMLKAILIGAVALAVGRLALTTQSGAVLEAHFDEASLSRVLGLYFTVANFIALVLQLGFVGRALARGALPSLNLAWGIAYLGAQLALALGNPGVGIALGARAVESELRNAVRTPIANLLYEVMAPARQARARTLVIGVAIPLAALAGGLLLAAVASHPHALSALGIAGALLLVGATLAQNRAWRRGVGAPKR